ncbi:MAG: DEAD/DEAH box helicase [Acidobacteria bacterium]|nr:DEAD/DEAH box helicase [Acidobacteriota bacterium]
MHDPKKQERRRRLLKERKDAERRESDLDEAEYLSLMARRVYRTGDVPGAARAARKALLLNPEDLPALDLLGHIHYESQQYADAAYFFGLTRKNPKALGASYNVGLAHLKLGRTREALEDFQNFLDATASSQDVRWIPLRENATRWCKDLVKTSQSPVPPPPPPPAVKAPEMPSPERKKERPPAPVSFTLDPVPSFGEPLRGSLADYFLRRRLLELELARNFEDLISLPTLHEVDTYHYQQETVRKVLRQFKGRALLADEVGLGKTIEACLVLKEYWTRGMVRRALVLTPPSLVSQWKGELTEKFAMTPASPDGSEFRSDPARFWNTEPLIVASIALARIEPHASMVASAAWDMVIVDEAHCLKNRTSANWKLVNSLNKKFILMLTATPVENNLLELFNLITVLKPGLLATEAEFRKQFVVAGKPKSPRNADQLRSLLGEVMVRNTRSAADVHLPHRIAASVVAEPSPAEEQVYRSISRFVAGRYAKVRKGTAGLALHLMQRQAGSSVQALGRAAARLLAQDDWIGKDDRRLLEEVQEIASQVLYSGKGLRLARMLSDLPGKAVVFTEFTPTLDHLAEICKQQGVRYALFRGDMSRGEKDTAIRLFRDEADVLLSTGSGGEGRNLQFANTVINFDLPWNPMRLEQRVGRVHRIGQTRDVFVFNFCQAGTIEEQLLRVLHDKINMFELVVGEIDTILGLLDEEGDFAELVLDLWLSARESGNIEQAFDGLAEKLLNAKKQYSAARLLDETLLQRDFEV